MLLLGRSALRAWGSTHRLAARATAAATGAAFISVFITSFISREALIDGLKQEDSNLTSLGKDGVWSCRVVFKTGQNGGL
jgi:hypothetical protein